MLPRIACKTLRMTVPEPPRPVLTHTERIPVIDRIGILRSRIPSLWRAAVDFASGGTILDLGRVKLRIEDIEDIGGGYLSCAANGMFVRRKAAAGEHPPGTVGGGAETVKVAPHPFPVDFPVVCYPR